MAGSDKKRLLLTALKHWLHADIEMKIERMTVERTSPAVGSVEGYRYQ